MGGRPLLLLLTASFAPAAFAGLEPCCDADSPWGRLLMVAYLARDAAVYVG